MKQLFLILTMLKMFAQQEDKLRLKQVLKLLVSKTTLKLLTLLK